MIVLIIDNYTYVVFDEENDEDHMVILLLYQHYDGASANALRCNAQCAHCTVSFPRDRTRWDMISHFPIVIYFYPNSFGCEENTFMNVFVSFKL